MKENMFRGRAKSNNKWLYYSNKDAIDTCIVSKPSISEFTGAYDKNNTRIFEGDVVKAKDTTYVICFYEKKWLAQTFYGDKQYVNIDIIKDDCKIIGNIYG